MAASCPKELASDFIKFIAIIEKNRQKREAILDLCKELNISVRKITGFLQVIHYNFEQTEEACRKSREVFIGVKAKYSEIAALLEVNDYYRFHSMWRNYTQQMCFLAMLIVYLEKGQLATPEVVAEILGVNCSKKTKGIILPIELYLTSCCFLASELARFAISCGSQGNFDKSVLICTFVLQLAGNIRSLDIKNEVLQKKLLGIKVEVQKVESTLYELKVRRILHKDPDSIKIPGKCEQQ